MMRTSSIIDCGLRLIDKMAKDNFLTHWDKNVPFCGCLRFLCLVCLSHPRIKLLIISISRTSGTTFTSVLGLQFVETNKV